jgi:hypothetical protein
MKGEYFTTIDGAVERLRDLCLQRQARLGLVDYDDRLNQKCRRFADRIMAALDKGEKGLRPFKRSLKTHIGV